MMPGATRVDAGDLGKAQEAEQDASQRSVPGKQYTYSQDNEEVVVEVRLPADTKAKDVSCYVKPEHLSLSVATLPEGAREVVCGELFQRVQADECSWTIVTVSGERVLQLTLSKQKPLRWLGLLRSG